MAQNFRHVSGLYRKLVLIVLILLASAGIFLGIQNWLHIDPDAQPIPIDTSPPTENGGKTEMEDTTMPLPVQLSEGQNQPLADNLLPLATGEPLSDAEIETVLSRLPALPDGDGEAVDFRIAQQPIPPPLTGETIQEIFPPPVQPAPPGQTDAGPLEVLRFAPEGEVPIAPFVNITFNQPMVPLTSLSELAVMEVPVRLDPPLPGIWRWLGTKTLTFEYDSEKIDRLPKATEFQVTIPVGIKSALGGILKKTVEWTFTTPPPKVITTYPYAQPQPLDPLFFIAFDQRIDPANVLGLLSVTAGIQQVGINLANEEDIKSDRLVSDLIKITPEGRWLAFKALKPLPPDSDISVVIPSGTPSAEGPLVTVESQSYGFRTFAPLRIVEFGCSWYGESCPPLSPFFIRFNNPLDLESFQENLLQITPELPGLNVNTISDTINIQGATKSQTTYSIIVDGKIKDVFGQALGDDTRLKFKVGKAEPALVGPEQTFITLDPASIKPVFSVYTISNSKLDVQIYAVQPSDWPEFKNYLREYQQTDAKLKLPGRLVMDKTLNLNTSADTLSEVGIDLSQVMEGSSGQFIVVVKPPRTLFKEYPYWQTVHTWVQVTRIGLDAFNDHSNMLVWTTSLLDGAPLSAVNIEAGFSNIKSVSDKNGISRFAIPEGISYLVASKGTDVAMLPRSTYYWDDDPWTQRTVNDELRWYMFDDRQMYRPGEEIHIKGWLRRIGGKQDGDVGLVGKAVSAINYQVVESQGNTLGSGRAEVNALGGFDFVFTIPREVNLGGAQFNLQAEGYLTGLDNTQYTHSFQIQEFRRPEFEVTARNETTAPYFVGGHAVLAVEAKYYAGGALPNAEVTWQVTSTPSNYNPPNWPDFTFGIWQPWWFFEPTNNGETESETFSGLTDVTGNHFLRLDFENEIQPRPVSIAAEATVMDINRQAWTGTTTLLVHPADIYVGLRSERYFVERGTPIKIDLIVTDLAGKPVSGQAIEVQAARLEWKYQDDEWVEVEVDIQKCGQTSTLEPVTCKFETSLGGRYLITARVTDALGRKNQTQFTRWVSGGDLPPARKVEQETVTLIPDKETYQPGDRAQILVQSPFSPAEGLLTVSRSGTLYTQSFQIKEGSITLTVPIEEKHIPNLNIQVDLVGASPRTDDQGEPITDTPTRPAYAVGEINLKIPPLQRTLKLKVTPELTEMEPGGTTIIEAVLKDAEGEPVPDAELAVFVVDEAVLALTGYQISDPVNIFYAQRSADLASIYSRASIVLTDPQALAEASRDQAGQSKMIAAGAAELPSSMPMPTQVMEGMAPPAPENAATPAIPMRLDFNPLAAFSPVVRTNAKGEARVPLKLPDNLTRYRVMAVAVDNEKRFGVAESNVLARLPLMVRPSPPRFLNFGDQFDLPVVLQNQTDFPLVAEVALRSINLNLTGYKGLRVTIPARDRIEVQFPAAAQNAGTARLQIASVAGDFTDAVTVEFPVYTPATTEAFATYGVLDEGTIFQPLAAPDDVFPQYGGLEINTSSTALQALTDAVLYLVSYPFECSEQLASRILAVAALRDVLTAFEADGLPSPEEMQSAVQRDLGRLQGLQNDDGGFPYWRHGSDSIPFNTIHVAHALQRAELKGFDVPTEMKQPLLQYLQEIEINYPSWYSQNTRWTLSAYALYVRHLMSNSDPDKALNLLNEAGLDGLGLDGIGWIWPVLQDRPPASDQLKAIRTYVNNHVVETPGAANFTNSYDDQTYLLLSSDRRTDAILLESLITDNPQADLIPKLVNGLMAHRTRGHWSNTQENVFVLLALDHYFNTYETQTPDFIARIWLGDTYAGSQEFRGRTTDRHETLIPMSYLLNQSQVEGETKNLILSKKGAGRLYYRMGMRYAPTSLKMEPLEMGFVVTRSYEAVDDPEEVYQAKDGTWHIKGGARVRVRLQMVADNRRYHVALTDPLPAGLEIVNPLLAVSGSIPQDPTSPGYSYGWWWWGPWFEHQNLRDERAEAFTSMLWDGVYQYTYLARATTPGHFIVPPAKAEEMYSPEVFGRSGSDVVIVE
jgi:uncharacterized protein YfaS (alpha-2-macroglobulin family)